jgi:ABC-2 type transport system permease protein
VAEYARLYLVLSWARVRADWQYRVPFLMFTVTQFAITFLDFLLIAILFERVPRLGGWSLPEVAFLFGTSGISFYLGDVFISQVERVGQYVKDGRLDSLLVRPLPVLFQLSTDEFAFRRFGKLAQASIVLAVAIAHLNLPWTPARVAMMFVMIASGAVIFSAIWVAGTALTFWAVDAQEVVNSFTYGGNFLTQFPLAVYSTWLRRLLAFIVPLAFVNYFPALYILGRRDTLGAPGFVRFLSPLVAVAMVVAARAAWRGGIRHYQSTGS